MKKLELMTSPIRKALPVVALTLACSLGAFGLGVATGQQTTPAAIEDGTGVVAQALTTSGNTVQLTSSQLDEAEESSQPLDPEDATFESNMDLTEAEVIERNEEVGESYNIGESVTEEDLEFLRIYAFSAEEPATEQAVSALASTDGPVINSALAGDGPSIQLVSAQTFPFNATKTLAGTKANIAGSVTADVGAGISSSWSATWTAKRVSGTSLTKIKSQAHVYAYGLTSVKPFVGLIYEAHPSATSTAQSMVFSRTANFTGVNYYMTVDAVSTFYNAAGSFQISGF